MPLQSYAVLKCRVLEGKEGSTASPHYQIHGIDENNTHYRIAVNIRSQTNPSDLLYYCDENFDHPIISKISALVTGLTPLVSAPNSAALDFIRGNLFDHQKMQILPAELPGADNDLNEKIAKYVGWANTMNNATIYAFGAPWGPEEKADLYFNFIPGYGIHDIHMNQGNSGKWASDNGPWQDGGLFIHFPAIDKWVAIFLAFQSQSFHSDDLTGDPLDYNLLLQVKGTVRIIAAVINPTARNRETVILVNTTNQRIDITDWAIIGSPNIKRMLYGEIRAGEFLTIPLTEKAARLTKDGGIITLLNQNGVKIDGVSYTEKDCQKTDATIIF
jgi:uncharacterized protein YukJ